MPLSPPTKLLQKTAAGFGRRRDECLNNSKQNNTKPSPPHKYPCTKTGDSTEQYRKRYLQIQPHPSRSTTHLGPITLACNTCGGSRRAEAAIYQTRCSQQTKKRLPLPSHVTPPPLSSATPATYYALPGLGKSGAHQAYKYLSRKKHIHTGTTGRHDPLF